MKITREIRLPSLYTCLAGAVGSVLICTGLLMADHGGKMLQANPLQALGAYILSVVAGFVGLLALWAMWGGLTRKDRQ